MKPTTRLATYILAGMIALGSSAASATDRTTRNTVIGAGLGALAGAVLTEGNTWATLGGAAAGGVLGNLLTEERPRQRYGHHGGRHRSEWRPGPNRHHVGGAWRHDRRNGAPHHGHRHR